MMKPLTSKDQFKDIPNNLRITAEYCNTNIHTIVLFFFRLIELMFQPSTYICY